MSAYVVSLADIQAAAARIGPHIHRTPVMTSRILDGLAGRALLHKAELLQKTGSFKARGALNAVLSLSEDEAARGVVTHSSGNHGQALAWAARARGVPAAIVMPTNAPAAKRAAVAGYGARVVGCAPTARAREETARQVAEDTGAVFIHPSNDPRVIAGQGTIGLELLEQAGGLDAVIVPVGGGGMISGIAVVMRAAGVRTFAAEPAGADDTAQAKVTGARVTDFVPDTIADGLRTPLSPNPWPIVRDLVEDVIVVDDDAIRAAMRLVWSRMKLVIEPSSAVGVAAALTEGFRARPGMARVGVVLCGGNVDLDALPWGGDRIS
ncbi:MAG: pyridoxal-phosphate dependent enzyme [Alphaproteobacteria bacterium]|nr:pyridoxal-phosphate dependent enzyme [Alphaproteobacteria bacterium]